MMSDWPLPRPRKWLQYVNEPETEDELAALRRSCNRGTPYGSPEWIEKTAVKLGLESTLRHQEDQRSNKLDLSLFRSPSLFSSPRLLVCAMGLYLPFSRQIRANSSGPLMTGAPQSASTTNRDGKQ